MAEGAPTDQDLVPLRVWVRPQTVKRLRADAAREGASVEALAALWLDEQAQRRDEGTAGEG